MRISITSSLVSAVSGSDYTEVASTTLTFPAGSVDSDMSQCIDVSITDDSTLEDPETFTVTLTRSEAYVMLGNAETAVTISDNDGKFILLSDILNEVSSCKIPAWVPLGLFYLIVHAHMQLIINCWMSSSRVVERLSR